ncbi:hypothetical protein MUJ63_10195 [Lachnospiraceae bacterium NSJ-143]|nr:hypothetical protein [Lachnospiraceae bacterium NSJ-143]
MYLKEKIDSLKIAKIIIIFVGLILTLLTCLREPIYAEIDSFTLPVASVEYRGSLFVTQQDIDKAREIFPEIQGNIYTFDDLRSSKLIVYEDGKWLPWYIPIYSILCIPMNIVLSVLNLPQYKTFEITNLLLYLSALLYVYRNLKSDNREKLFLILLLLFSPALFYIQYIGYEICIFSFMTMALVSYYNKQNYRAAVFLSIASLNNIGVLGVGVVMIAKYLFDIFWNNRKNNFISTIKENFKPTVVYACTYLISLITVYYNIAIQSKYMVSDVAKTLQHYWGRVAMYFFDINLGYASFALLALLLLIGLSIYGLKKKNTSAIIYLTELMCVVMMFSVMEHINCGMIYCARYVIWSYPIIAVAVALNIHIIEKKIIQYIIIVICIISSTFCMVVNKSVRSYPHQMNEVSKFILDHAPSLYNPLYSTFYCRVLHVDGAYWFTEPVGYTDSKSECLRKLILLSNEENKATALNNYTGDEKSMEYLKNRLDKIKNDNKYHYINISPNEEYILYEKNMEEKGLLVSNKQLFDNEHEFLFNGTNDIEVYGNDITIKPNLWYKIDILFDEKYSPKSSDFFAVDLYGDGYDTAEQEIQSFVKNEKVNYTLFINSGAAFEGEKNVYVRLISKSREQIIVKDIKVTEMKEVN